MALLTSDVVGSIATVATLVYFVSPAFTIIKIVKDKSVGSFSAFPFVSGVGNTVMWVYYSAAKMHDTGEKLMPNLVVNAIGATCMTVYLIFFAAFAKERKQRVLVEVSMLVVGVVGLILIFEMVIPKLSCDDFFWGKKETPLKERVCGFVLVVLNVSMYASPLATMGTVIRTKSAEFLPWNMSVVGIVVCFLWATQGFMINDINVWLPNVAGLFLSLAQLVLFLVYCGQDRSVRNVDSAIALARDE
eukprot:TRINITY_DN8233_c0_g2_i1.p1 TRINITY_DN8233_c0_g2~~TRINITY_DN8233_c0_g2_i1.p1  ORF type:complete len:246 (-),score=25.80 TRINITY_DN8233_c0_g2_i1:91-828(-)